MAVTPIPEDRPQITPYLIVAGVDKLIAFLTTVFNAKEVDRTTLPSGRVAHAEVAIGRGRVMMGEPTEQWKPMPGSVYIYVEDCDAAYKRATNAGAAPLMEPTTMYHGDRYGGVQDPTGNQWWIVTHVEDVPPDEMQRRQAEMFRQMEG
jgi:uncharacterized glyoxalase superfamily protein PhnB